MPIANCYVIPPISSSSIVTGSCELQRRGLTVSFVTISSRRSVTKVAMTPQTVADDESSCWTPTIQHSPQVTNAGSVRYLFCHYLRPNSCGGLMVRNFWFICICMRVRVRPGALCVRDPWQVSSPCRSLSCLANVWRCVCLVLRSAESCLPHLHSHNL